MSKNTPLLSVVVPVYNVAQHLDECLQSLLNQGFDENELEVIMVNDGSTDGSELIAKRWSENYSNFIHVNRDNGGLSAARNTGIEYIKGDFMIFLDSDDVVPSNAYKNMLAMIQKSGSDMLTGAVWRFKSSTRNVWKFDRSQDLFLKDREKLTIASSPEYIRDATPWNKMYRTQFFKDSGVRFPEGRIYEDIATSPKLYCLAKSFDVFSSPSYYWRVNEGGITQTVKPVKAIDRLWAIDQIIDYFKRNKISSNVVKEFDFAIADYSLRWVFLDLWQFDRKSQEVIIEHCCRLAKDIDDDAIEQVSQPIKRWLCLAKSQQKQKLLKILKVEQRGGVDTSGKPFFARVILIAKRYTRVFKRRMLRFVKKAKNLLKALVIYVGLRPIIFALPLKEKTALFSCYWGSSFSSAYGPSAICLQLAKTRPDFKLVIFYSRSGKKTVSSDIKALLGRNKQVELVRNHTFKYYYHLWTAKYLFNDVNFQLGYKHYFTKKRSGQIEVQTTHGTPLKKMGVDSSSAISKKNEKEFLAKSRRYDYLTSAGPTIAKIFSSSHMILPKILKTGLPQNDTLFTKYSKDDIANLKKKYHLDQNKQIVLYAPTFRYKKGCAFRYLADIKKIHNAIGHNSQIILKPHPFNHTDLDSIDFSNLIEIGTSKEGKNIILFGEIRRTVEAPDTEHKKIKETYAADINELALISDCLITDYSSMMFNYAHLDKPMIFFTPDIEHYEATRGNYFNIDTIAPGAVAKDSSEIVESIRLAADRTAWNKKYEAQLKKFKKEFTSWERGNAANKVLKEIGIL